MVDLQIPGYGNVVTQPTQPVVSGADVERSASYIPQGLEQAGAGVGNLTEALKQHEHVATVGAIAQANSQVELDFANMRIAHQNDPDALEAAHNRQHQDAVYGPLGGGSQLLKRNLY